MIYITNEDKPGLIGGLGTIFGEEQVNIASFFLGRDRPGGNAIAIIQIDDPVGDDVLAKVMDLPHVHQAKSLSF
jgi:D-3-phosphoglycerate dehydrogenase